MNTSVYEPPPAEGWLLDDTPIPFMQLVGPVFYRQIEGAYEYGFTSKPDIHGNLHGRLHGGMIATFADYALGHSCWLDSNGIPHVTIHLGLDYMQAGLPGEWTSCRVQFVRKTRTLCFMRGEIYSGGKHLTTATGIWKVVPKKE